MNFGFTVDESSSFAVMDAAVDAGVNFFDTADVYGAAGTATTSCWVRRCTSPMGLGPNDRRLSAYHIRRACQASLRRLQTDHIGL